MSQTYPRIASFKTAAAFRARLEALDLTLPFDETIEQGDGAPLAAPQDFGFARSGNRFAILPMEGWDGTLDGRPTDLTQRRWSHFGRSGAKLIWGGEAVAVRHDGRANPNQLAIGPHAERDLAALCDTLTTAHRERFGRDDDLVIGLQLTHSGRFSRPDADGRPRPLVAYAHPVLDRRLPPGTHPAVLNDGDIDRLIDDFVAAAGIAARAGFQFVDLKHCHGYLGHELLTSVERPGRYGGSFENRTRFLRNLVDGIRARVPGLHLAVRLSAFDTVPYRKDLEGVGTPETDPNGYRFAFGLMKGPHTPPDLADTSAFLRLLESLDVRLVCLSAGSPYYTPHIQRPALFPPSDGYLPPEDPLAGVARQIRVTAALRRAFPNLVFVGSAYSYLQEWLPHVAQAAVRERKVDVVGLGRMVLSYPDLPADVLAGRPLARKSICRTFSDCTTGPRNGLISGCFPLDPFYGGHPHAERLKAIKAAAS